jgi:photosystem II stability/assembly factor-like uncharacterized protein
VGVSADGTHMYAAQNGLSVISASVDGGANWTSSSTITMGTPGSSFTQMRVTTAGAIAYALADTVYATSNSGASWAAITTLPPAVSIGTINSIAASADGSKLWLATSLAGILQSADSGATWIPSGAPALSWITVSVSADGRSLLAGETTGGLYRSEDGGNTWIQVNAPAAGVTWAVPIAASANLQNALAYAAWSFAVATPTVPADHLYRIAASTTPGTAGALSGGQFEAVALQFVGANTFLVLNASGNLVVK